MNIAKLKLLTYCLSIIAFTGISSFAHDRDISGVRWELVQARGQTDARFNAYLEIESDERRFAGNGGCNQMWGKARIMGRRINFSDIGLTRRMCTMDVKGIPEHTFVRYLEDAARYQRSGNLLTLYDRHGRMLLQFRKASGRPDGIGLADRKWVLETIGSGRPPVRTRAAFVVFDPQKASVGGDSGCNVFGGKYSSVNDSLSIKEIISTMRACEEGDKMEIERGLLNGLRTANRYDIRDGRLYLYRNRNLILTFAGERKGS